MKLFLASNNKHKKVEIERIFKGHDILLPAEAGIHYLHRETGSTYLENAMGRHWIAKAMLAVLHFKRKQYGEMKTIFEKTVKRAKKESFVWNLYAWCLWKTNDRDGAIDVLSRGLEYVKEDQRLEGNRLALQNKKKMKMRGWSEMWYQFHLDKPPQPKMQIDRRQMYRGR